MTSESERRTATILQVVRDILTVIVVPVLGWLLLQTIEVQKDILSLRNTVEIVAKDVKAHAEDSEKDYGRNANLHHTARIFPCNGCHVGPP